MLLAVFSNYLILLVILGYSFFLKKITYNKDKIIIENIDILYGLSFIIFISLFFNFFFSLVSIKIVVIGIGLFIFLYALSKKVFKLNFFTYFLIIFLTTYIAFYNGANIDSPMYHLQILNWLSNHKISFGLSNLEIRLGFNSTWHSLVALLDINFFQFSLKYYLSSLILAFIIYESARAKIKIYYSDLFLFLAISYLIFYSFLHPYLNGVILNHLGNPERDIVGMLFFFLIIFLFFKILENKDNYNYINLLILSIFLCITSRLNMAPILILLFFVLYKNRKYKILNLTNILLFITSILWILRSFFLSGCLFFPFSQSCFKTSWAVNVKEVVFFVEEAMRISRTLPTRNGVNDLNFSLNSFDWIPQWIHDYYFSAALLQIGSILMILSFVLFLLIMLIKKNSHKSFFNIADLWLIFCLILIIFLWFISAPETRYALGPIISLPCLFIIIFLKSLNFIKFIKHKDIRPSLTMGILCILLASKSFDNFQIKDLLLDNKNKHNYSHIVKIGKFNEQNFYWGNFLCADFKNICVNTIKENYKIDRILNYNVYKSDTWIKK